MRLSLNMSARELIAVVIAVAAVVVYLRAPTSAAGFVHAIADLACAFRAGG